MKVWPCLVMLSLEVSMVYSPPEVDRIRLWVHYNKIPYAPYSIYLRVTIRVGFSGLGF